MDVSMGAADAAAATQRREYAQILRRAVYAVGAGALLALGFPPYGLFFLPPLGVAVLLLGLQGTTVRQGLYTGLLCGAVFFGGTLFWLANIFGAGAVTLCAILAVFFGLFGAVWGALTRHLPRVPVWLLAPVLWTGIEYYRSEPFALQFGWMGLGYGLVNSPVWAKTASVVGSYGVSFLAALVGGLLAAGFLLRPRDGGRLLWTAVGAYAVWLALGFVPLPTPTPERPLRVRLVQGLMEDTLFEQTKQAAGRPVDILVWPEYALERDPFLKPEDEKAVRSVARENRCHFLFGAKKQFDPKDDEKFSNTAYLLGPDGRTLGTHVKNHTVHFIKEGKRGTEARAIPTALGKLGVAICFDMDFPDVARRLAADGAEVFLVPNMDPAEWGPVQRMQHRLMFQMRAAECGRWLARADCSGGTSVAAPSGQQVAWIAGTGTGLLETTIGRRTETTPFVRGGWRFGQVCLIASIGLALVALAGAWNERGRRSPSVSERAEQ